MINGYTTHFFDHGCGYNNLKTAISNRLFGAVCMCVAVLSSWCFPACLNWEIQSQIIDSRYSGMYHSVVGSLIPNILKDCSTSFLQGPAAPTRRYVRNYWPTETVVFQQMWICRNDTVRSYICISKDFSAFIMLRTACATTQCHMPADMNIR